MPTLTGLDVLARDNFSRLRGKSIGLLCNQASIAKDIRHVIELMLEPHRRGDLKIQGVFGPEHGLWGHTQDNMIEWEGLPDARTGLIIHSLYGQHREPTEEMLQGIDQFVVDVFDVGSRYYTFIWSMALCMKACEPCGIPVMVLDRPNPINGVQVEGTLLEQAFDSFVGLYPLPTRHGMTAGEVATYLKQTQFPDVQLEVVRCEGWSREMYFEGTGQPWAMPSPNMPTVDTAVVYPGQCILEATKLSEGRGTTRPFEIFGAPFIDGWKLSSQLNGLNLPGVYFRPLQFEPTFNKHAKEVCEGSYMHVLDRRAFEPVLTTIAILQEIVRLYADKFEWRSGPYEYEYEKTPIDILAGNAWLRPAIDNLTPLSEIRERMRAECRAFDPVGRAALLYS
jgi:uncharacterized protein YbbC (DUF1343 family)